jgi:carboxyl-terminal processing protease
VWEFLAAGCEALDAYGAYVTPTGLVLEKMLAEGKWVGVGLELVASDLGILISGVAAQSEARQHGVQPGSWLVKVNGEPIRAGSVEEAMLRLLGPAGTSVELEILTPAGDRQLVQLTRRQYEPTSVNGVEMLDSMLGIGYVRVESFQPSTPQELDRAVQELSRQGMRVLILDLRGNPGGSVRAALEVADRFIPGGVLLITQGRWPEVNVEYMARQGEDWQLPVIVLVDEHTASAAEMVAGALQAHAQAGHIVAALVGRPTRGKGVLQQCVPLAEGQAGAAYLTVARWLTPAGVPVSPQQPIQPDVLVKPMPMVADPMMDMDLPPMMFPNPSNTAQQTAWHAALGKAIELFRK